MKRLPMILLITLLAIFTACTDPGNHSADTTDVPIYFLAPANSSKGSDALQCSLEPLDLSEGASLTQKAHTIINRLLQGSHDGLLRSPFPQDTTLSSVEVKNRRAHVDFSGSLSHMDGVALTLVDYCLTLTLSAIDGIESVAITVDGRPLAQQPRQIFRERDVVLSTKDSVLQLVEATLYFMDETGALSPETRTLEIYEGETQSGNLIAALMDGPHSEDLFPIIPDTLVISSIKVEDGICRINFPNASLQTLPEDAETQQLILYSLTRSLYSLDHIKGIRFSGDGVEIMKFGLIPLSDVIKRPRS